MRITAQIAKSARIASYENNPAGCIRCGNPLPYRRSKTRRFCGHSCAAIFRSVGGNKPFQGICESCSAPCPSKQKNCSDACRKISQERKTIALIADRKCPAARLKRYIISHFGRKCMDPKCAWNHAIRPVCLELHHEDGNSENNTIENVRLLCPNCHSLTDTYKSKNVGKGRQKRKIRYQEGMSY